MDSCGDNRFEIIEEAKRAIIESTNIEESKEEMKVLDTFLFRCWQMGWLDKYDTKKYISEKECGDCDIYKQLSNAKSEDLIPRKLAQAVIAKPISSKEEYCEAVRRIEEIPAF